MAEREGGEEERGEGGGREDRRRGEERERRGSGDQGGDEGEWGSAVEDGGVEGKVRVGGKSGDLCGVARGEGAYRMSRDGKEGAVGDGGTGEQGWFSGVAQIWRGKIRDDALRQQLLTNPHSPGDYRAMVPLINNDVFEKTFDVKPGDKMYLAPADRVKIW